MALKKFLGNFYEFDETLKAENKANDAEASKDESKTDSSPVTNVAISSTPQSVQSSYGSIDSKMLTMLDAAIAEANQPGFDYFEFAEALNNLSSLPEPQRFQAVFTTVKSMGVTPQGLVESVEFYQKVLAKEQENFIQHVESKRQNEVVVRQNMKHSNEEAISRAKEQIVELQQKIAELQHQNIVLDAEISKETLQIDNTSSSFEATYSAVLKRLEDDKAKIKTHLSEGA